jgi:hypothetical protein
VSKLTITPPDLILRNVGYNFDFDFQTCALPISCLFLNDLALIMILCTFQEIVNTELYIAILFFSSSCLCRFQRHLWIKLHKECLPCQPMISCSNRSVFMQDLCIKTDRLEQLIIGWQGKHSLCKFIHRWRWNRHKQLEEKNKMAMYNSVFTISWKVHKIIIRAGWFRKRQGHFIIARFGQQGTTILRRAFCP